MGCSSAASVPDSDHEAASILSISFLASFLASLLAFIYSLIPYIWLLEPDLTLYDALIFLMQEVFIPKLGTVLAMKYHVQKPRLV